MKQIAYLSMVFLPATFVSVCLQFKKVIFTFIINLHQKESFQYERARDRARYQWHHITLLCDHRCVYTPHHMGDYCFPEQIQFPVGCDFLAATGLACILFPPNVWQGSICANGGRFVRTRNRPNANRPGFTPWILIKVCIHLDRFV